MEFTPEGNRLGIGFLASVLIHISFFLLLAVLSTESLRPAIPEAKKIMVELFDRPVEDAGVAPEEMTRVADKSKTVEKEFAPKAVPEQIIPPGPSARAQEVTVVPTPPETLPDKKPEAKPISESIAPSEVLPEPEIEKIEEKQLPALKELIPSYDKLASHTTDAQPERDVAEGDAISLNTTELKYLSYFSKLKDRIQMVWRYPEAAKVLGLEGRIVLKFVINRDGTLKDLQVVRSSGVDILDDEALKAIRRAAPFYAIPENLGDILSIVANFEYELDYYYVK